MMVEVEEVEMIVEVVDRRDVKVKTVGVTDARRKTSILHWKLERKKENKVMAGG